jgi:hypothetical protein
MLIRKRSFDLGEDWDMSQDVNEKLGYEFEEKFKAPTMHRMKRDQTFMQSKMAALGWATMAKVKPSDKVNQKAGIKSSVSQLSIPGDDDDDEEGENATDTMISRQATAKLSGEDSKGDGEGEGKESKEGKDGVDGGSAGNDKEKASDPSPRTGDIGDAPDGLTADEKANKQRMATLQIEKAMKEADDIIVSTARVAHKRMNAHQKKAKEAQDRALKRRDPVRREIDKQLAQVIADRKEARRLERIRYSMHCYSTRSYIDSYLYVQRLSQLLCSLLK